MSGHTTMDAVEQMEEALRQREQAATAIPDLTRRCEVTAEARRAISEELERVEGDALIGSVAESTLKAIRARHESAVIEDRKAAATLRQAQEDIRRLDEAIHRVRPEAYAIRIAAHRARVVPLVREFKSRLDALRPLNDALREAFREAEKDFPPVVSRHGTPTGYRVAAGLPDLSWPELRLDRHAAEGGRYGAWSKRVEAFLAEVL